MKCSRATAGPGGGYEYTNAGDARENGHMLTDMTETTTADIRAALARTRDQMGVPAPGRASRAASQAGREPPCRVLGVIARESRASSRLDAEIRSGEGTPGQTGLLRLQGRRSEHADSVVMPLMVPDTPVVTWWHGLIPAVPSAQPLGVLAQRRVTDAARARAPAEGLGAAGGGVR